MRKSALVMVTCLSALLSGAAEWIGEHGETEFVWQLEEAKKLRGVKPGNCLFNCANPLKKNTLRLRRTFVSDKKRRFVKATIDVATPNFYELWLNGIKVDPTRVLAPGIAKKGVYVQSYDVTNFVKPVVPNTVGLWLAPGYADDFNMYGWVWLSPKRAWIELRLTYADGTTETIPSDDSWFSTTETPIPEVSIYHGERYEPALEDSAWCLPTGSTNGWDAVCVFPDGPERLTFAPPVICMSDPRKPVRIIETEPNVYTVDFGQNRAGFVEIRAKGKKGTVITIHTSELLGANGKIDPWSNRLAKATDTFVLAGTGEVETFCPRFTYHGFQFAEVRGYPGKLTAADLTGWAVHADVKATSSFRCSDERLNRLHEMANWSMLSNFMSYPSDCPSRDERTPCCMDSQAYEETSCQFYDMREFYHVWLENQGVVTGGNPDWAGDSPMLPWRLWTFYGERQQLENHYLRMKGFVDAHLAQSPDGIFEKGYGDWCAPNAGTWESFFNDVGVVNSTLFHAYVRNLVRAAQALGKFEDATKYAAAVQKTKAGFNAKFFDREKGIYGDGSQATFVLPLKYGLVPADEHARVVSNLLARIRDVDKGTMDVGIFGAGALGEVLCEEGYADVMVDLYTQTNYPGYGFMLASGATTMWEQWTYRGPMNSHSHAMFASGIGCFYTHLAGIRPAKAGYAEVLIKPCFPQQLAFVEATRLTPRGEIAVKWRRQGSAILIEATLPPNVPGRLVLPNGREFKLKAGLNRQMYKEGSNQ